MLIHFPITTDNFTVAWTTLNDRFGNKRRLLNVHLSKLFPLKTVCRDSSYNESIEALKALDRALQDDTSIFIKQLVDNDTREAS